MSALKTPILSVLIGEGGSGGALALAVADEVWMLENSVYSVISPEGCASILWKDASKTADAAECLKLTAQDLYKFGVIERIISEENGFEAVYKELNQEMTKKLKELKSLPVETLTDNRYNRFRRIGVPKSMADPTENKA